MPHRGSDDEDVSSHFWDLENMGISGDWNPPLKSTIFYEFKSSIVKVERLYEVSLSWKPEKKDTLEDNPHEALRHVNTLVHWLLRKEELLMKYDKAVPWLLCSWLQANQHISAGRKEPDVNLNSFVNLVPVSVFKVLFLQENFLVRAYHFCDCALSDHLWYIIIWGLSSSCVIICISWFCSIAS